MSVVSGDRVLDRGFTVQKFDLEDCPFTFNVKMEGFDKFSDPVDQHTIYVWNGNLIIETGGSSPKTLLNDHFTYEDFKPNPVFNNERIISKTFILQGFQNDIYTKYEIEVHLRVNSAVYVSLGPNKITKIGTLSVKTYFSRYRN